MHLLTNSFVTLMDANGLIALTVQAASPLSWPDLFGVVAQQNTVTPRISISSIVYNPPGGAPGMSRRRCWRRSRICRSPPGDPNFVVTKVNAHSRFIKVPAPPPGPAPAGFPAAPTQLASWRHDRSERHRRHHLSDGAADRIPRRWPPSFGVLTQDDISDPRKFNLLVVYAPSRAEWEFRRRSWSSSSTDSR